MRPAEPCFVVPEVAWPIAVATDATAELATPELADDELADAMPMPGAPVAESGDDLTATAARLAVGADTGDHESVEDDDLLELSGGPGLRDQLPPATIPLAPRRETPLAPVAGLVGLQRPSGTASIPRVDGGAPPPLPARATRSAPLVDGNGASGRLPVQGRGRAHELQSEAELVAAQRAFSGVREAARWYAPSSGAKAAPDDFARLMLAVVSDHDVDPDVRRTTAEWFAEIFDESWVRLLPAEYPARCRREAAFAAESLRLAPGAQLLDVGCGVGLHAIDLAARGVQVTGLDLSRTLLELATAEARRYGIGVRFAHGDMRQLSFDSQFDAVTVFGQTFGYFSDAENLAVLESLTRSLRMGGRILLDIVNRDWLVQRVPRKNWWDPPGLIVMEDIDYDFASGRVLSLRTIVDGDQPPWEQHMSTRVYSAHEIHALFEIAGLRVVELSGSIAQRGAFLGACDRWMVVVGERVR
jgi:SAM-dependent methyltransferase